MALRPRLETLVFSLSQQLHTAYHPEALRLARKDAQAFLLPAVELIDLINQPLDDPPEALLGPLALKAFNASASSDETLFGSTREINWTQFEPRAHYTHSEALQGYFRAMSWLSLIDLRIDARADNRALRELGTAVVVTLALRDAGLMDDWQEIDRILTTFIGQADSLTPPQLLEILQSEKLAHLSAFTSPTSLETLLARIQSGQAGMQAISAHPIAAPVGEEKRVLPRSFTFFSQRFTPESWALGRMVFDQLWRANPDPSGPPLRRIHRRLPSALDLAFSVLGNNTPAALLSRRMTTTDGVPYRDGHDFARELVSIRQVIDTLPATAWEDTLYLRQLAALRTLSAPLPPTVPEAMRTEAWNWKTVQTQLAGWTELRHDNLLYAKQSYTPSVLCLYPAGYVEPRPAFYTAMQQVVDFAHTTLAALPLTGTVPGRPTESDPPIPVDVAARQTSWLQHLTGMSATLGTLAEIAAHEAALTPFTDDQTTFLEGLVQSVGDL